MGLEKTYRTGGDIAASYDWNDLITGQGYKTFYGALSLDSTEAAPTYFLCTRSNVDSSSNFAGNDYGFRTHKTLNNSSLTVNFDITFNVPSIVESGHCYINVPWTVVTDARYGQMTVTVYHVRGVTTTSLGTQTAPQRLGETTSPYNSFMECFDIALTRKAFAIGDKLRLTVYMVDFNAGGISVYLYHDPSSSLTLTDVGSRTISTALSLDVPFKIDIV